MSMSLFLNPRLTTQQAIDLHKMQMDSAVSIANSFKANLEKIEDPKARLAYYNQVAPIVMQQVLMAMF